MKRFFKSCVAFGLACTLAFSIVGCGKSSNENETFKEDEVVSGDRIQADWIDTAIIYEVNVRQYTEEGTFDAFASHLERLKEMGVNTLWFMPIYPISELNKKGTLGSYYSIRDYMNVNSEFGSLDDFKELVNTAHDMGFHIILDWVANHTGWDHTWITEHPDYYMTDENGDIISPLNTDWNDVAQLNFTNEDMCNAMIDSMKFWVEEIGVDGFRCDYAQGVPINFWEKARAALDEIKPIYMVAEDGTNSDSLLSSAFDSNYNFDLYDSLKLASSVNNQADNLEKYIDKDLPFGAFKMNFIDNHDKNTYDGTISERFGDETLGALYTIIFTAEGLPLIYSGNEEDTDISLEFFEKDNIDFGDYKFSDMLSKFCTIKSTYEPLYNGLAGGNVRLIEDNNKNVIAYERVKNGKKITVIVNLSKDEQTVKYTTKISKGNILIHGDSTGIIDSENTTLNTKDLNKLNPYEYYIILSE